MSSPPLPRRIGRLAMLGLALLWLGACSTPPTPYQPGEPLNRYGYNQDQIDANTWRVSFAGNSVTDRWTVQDYMLYRAAELTVQAGYQGFIVLRDSLEKDTAYRGTTTYPYGPYYGGYYGGYRGGYYGGFGSAYGYTNLTPINNFSSFAEIRLFNDAAPDGLGQAYDAQAILRVIGQKIVRPLPSG